jgi:hypothetical protein
MPAPSSFWARLNDRSGLKRGVFRDDDDAVPNAPAITVGIGAIGMPHQSAAFADSRILVDDRPLYVTIWPNADGLNACLDRKSVV